MSKSFRPAPTRFLQLYSGNPDLVVIDTGSRSLAETEQLVLASDPTKRAVVLFVDQSNDGLIRAALQAGVSAYQRVTMLTQVRTELRETKQELEHRKVIDRAKGLLMSARGIDEAATYEQGFFDDEGLFVTLESQANWKMLPDRVIDGQLAGAHMLAGQPLATIGYGTRAHIVTPISMDLNGNGITVSQSV